MTVTPPSPAYLAADAIIDWRHPAVLKQAQTLAAGAADKTEIARRCFEFVRDEIRHSWDYRQGPVTCRASEVLQQATGYCYAKSHLLAALLRANGIPAGLCYQRLAVGEAGPPYCLHGLNAVWLEEHGWYRVDPRGNKEGVDAQFTPPLERLAFAIHDRLEADLPGIWAEPLPQVVRALTEHATVEAVNDNLPDLELLSPATTQGRPLRRGDRGLSATDARALLETGEYGFLATADGAGIPYGVPLSYCVADGALYFHCALEGRKLENLAARPQVSFCVVGKTELLPAKFSTRYESVSVEGIAAEVFGAEKERALAGLVAKYSPGYAEAGGRYIAADGAKTRVYRLAIDSLRGKARR